MAQEDGGYDLTQEPSGGGAGKPKPGEPGWVPPEVVVEKAQEGAEEEGGAVSEEELDIVKHKGVAVAAYLLFLIPLLVAPNSKFARFHANQGLLVFILWWVAVVIVVGLQLLSWLVVGVFGVHVPILYYFFSCAFSILQVAVLLGVLALMVMGIIHAANGEKKALPGVGHFQLIK